MNKKIPSTWRIVQILWFVAVGWTVLVAGSLGWNWGRLRHQVEALAQQEARSGIEKDLTYRRWAIMHGGVYVPVTEQTKPSPFLKHVSERDVTTPSGKELTLLNSSYMTRQVHDLANTQYGPLGHIASIKPINPDNKPDAWEERALKAFESGVAEVMSIEPLNNDSYLRLMVPMRTDQSCLKCHAEQGYQVGDIRGGLSISVPMRPYRQIVLAEMKAVGIAHGLFWLVGIAGLWILGQRLRTRIRNYRSAIARIRENETRFREIFNATNEAIFIHDVNGHIIDVNRKTCELYGYHHKEFLNLSIGDISSNQPPYTTDNAAECFRKVREKGPQVFEWQGKRKNGEIFWEEVALRLFKTAGQTGFVAAVRDISERKQAEEALRLNEARLKALLKLNEMHNASISELALFAMDEGVRLTNSRLGYIAFGDETGKQLVMYAWSKTAMEECMIADKPLVYQIEKTGLWGEAVRQRRPIMTNDYAQSNPWKKGYPEGHVHLIRHMNVPVFDGDHIAVLTGVGNKPTDYNESDIRQLELLALGLWRLIQNRRAQEDRERLEAQLLQAQKMEAIGQLAGGVAHDFNNLLTVIGGNAEILALDTRHDPETHNAIRAIIEAADQASAVTRALLTFSRKLPTRKEPIDLVDVVEKACRMLRRMLPASIELTVETPPAKGLWIHADNAQIQQVIMNLAINARDAMPKGGKLHIAARPFLSPEHDQSHSFREMPRQGTALLSVTDTGTGIEPEVQKRIFEPFYTTKPRGQGTGLGLSIIHGIVSDHSGRIEVHSEVGKGATFEVQFPLISAPGVEMAPDGQSGSRARAREEVILLAEDNERIRNLIADSLNQWGYRVFQAADGEALMKVAQEHGKAIHLMLLDVDLPKRDGLECLKTIRQAGFGCPAIMMTGSVVVELDPVMEESAVLLRKPFHLHTLRNLISNLLTPVSE